MKASKKQLIVASLLGISQQAASPVKNTLFPKYVVPLTVTPATDAAAFALTIALGGSAEIGGYQCIRSSMAYGFPQTVDNTTPTTVATAAGGIQAFYGTTLASLGTVGGANNCCCLTMATPGNCPCITKTGNAVVTGKLVWNSGAVPVAAPTSISTNTWMDDFILGSLYQESVVSGGVRGIIPCDLLHQDLVASGELIYLTQSLTAQKKCTYLISTTDATYAPQIKVSAASSYTTWQFQWAEWDKTAMATGGFLPATDTGPAYLGTYVATKPWPNPLKTTALGSITANALTFYEETDPKSTPPGDIDKLAFYPYLVGPFQDNALAVNTVSYSLVKQQYEAYTTMYNAFAGTKTSYDTLRTAYNTELVKEKKRQSGAFTSIFDPEIKLPTRPCTPDRPPAFTGIQMYWAANQAVFAQWQAAEKTLKYAVPDGNGSRVKDVAATRRSGFLQARVEDSSTTGIDFTPNPAGHIFGRLGQGAATEYGTINVSEKPFQWAVATPDHTLQVSVLPSDATASDQAAGDAGKIEFKAMAATFIDPLTELAVPTRPNGATPADPVGAMFLSLGLITSGTLALSTLY